MSDLVTSVREGLDVFFAPGPELLEVRILKTSKKTISGYFDSIDLAVEAVEEAVGLYTTNAAFYATMNSVTRVVHARARNRLKPYADCTTVDADILRRYYFLIDCDPKRPAGVSSTDAELAEALRVRDTAMAWLSAHGWPAGLRAMSGNGGHAAYLVDLPNDAATRDLFKDCLTALHQRFATPTVDLDRAVYNAARICKIYGTYARKGDPTAERPHRRAEIEERPILTAVTREQLQWLAARGIDPRQSRPGPGPTTARARPPAAVATQGARLDMRAEFDARGEYLGELHNGWHAVRCPWIDAHSGVSGISETAIREPHTAGGWWGFKCQHASCAGRTIRDVWAFFRPDEAQARPAAEARPSSRPPGLDPALLDDVTVVVAEGQRIARDGVPYVVEGIVPKLGMVGVLVAYAKVGKSTLGQHLAGAVATGARFLDRETHQVRVLALAAEDPPEYTAYLARHRTAVPAGQLTFYRQPIHLDAKGLAAISATVTAGGYGLVLISSWQSVVATLIKDENDNAGSVRVMDAVKAAARATGIPWLIDAHSGKGEDQSDEADPTRAMRGASAAAGSADFLVSLRYADGPFSPKRRLSGKGRFVSFAPILMAFDPETGSYTALGATKTALVETMWQMIVETGALTTTPQGATSIAVRCGLAPAPREVTGAMRRHIDSALRKRPGVQITSETRGDKTYVKYALEEPSPE